MLNGTTERKLEIVRELHAAGTTQYREIGAAIRAAAMTTNNAEIRRLRATVIGTDDGENRAETPQDATRPAELPGPLSDALSRLTREAAKALSAAREDEARRARLEVAELGKAHTAALAAAEAETQTVLAELDTATEELDGVRRDLERERAEVQRLAVALEGMERARREEVQRIAAERDTAVQEARLETSRADAMAHGRNTAQAEAEIAQERVGELTRRVAEMEKAREAEAEALRSEVATARQSAQDAAQSAEQRRAERDAARTEVAALRAKLEAQAEAQRLLELAIERLGRTPAKRNRNG